MKTQNHGKPLSQDDISEDLSAVHHGQTAVRAQAGLGNNWLNTSEVGSTWNADPNPGWLEKEEAQQLSELRRSVFRVLRLLLAGGLIYAAFLYLQYTTNHVSSQSAYITGDQIVLRTPIDGTVEMDVRQPGELLPAGTAVFRVINPRFGNKEAAARLAWACDHEDRLQTELTEAEVLHRQQSKIFAYHENLHTQNLISELEFVEEQTKWAMTHAVLTNKQIQLARAVARRSEAESQVGLQRNATVTMPFDGVVWKVLSRPGQHVSAGEPVLVLINPERVWVEAVVRERHAHKIQIGSKVKVHPGRGQSPWSGLVKSIRGDFGQEPQGQLAGWGPDRAPARQVVLRIAVDPLNLFGPREFFGLGRRVNLTLTGG